MGLFYSEEVYSGYSLEDLSKVRDALSKEKIKYDYKVNNHSGQWLNEGSRRGTFGSFGMNMNYEKQYIVYVKNSDYEYAKYLVDKVLIEKI